MKAVDLNPVKVLASRIHPPLPPTPYETRQLLSDLKRRYRERLNEAYPGPETTYAAGVGAPRQSPRQVTKPPKSSVCAVQRHIGRVLRNPLLESQHDDSSSLGNKSPVTIVSKSIAAFDRKVAMGTATLGDACACLSMHYENVRRQDRSVGRVALNDARLGSKVLDFLWSKGIDPVEENIKLQPLLWYLIPYLVAEARHDVLHNWLWGTSILDQHLTSWKTSVMHRVAVSRSHLGLPFADTMEQFLLDLHKQEEKCIDGDKESSICQVFAYTGLYLTYVLLSKDGPMISQSLYDRWLASAAKWDCLHLEEALMKVHHPQTPDLSLATELCSPTSHLAHEARLKPRVKRAFLKLCLDTSQKLLEIQDSAHAFETLKAAKELIDDPRYMGKEPDRPYLDIKPQSVSSNGTQRQKHRRQRVEEKHLEILQGFAFA